MEQLFIITIGILSRLVPHPANMTAIGGLALYSGAKVETKKAILLVLISMFVSDIVLGFHSLMWATYGSLIIAVCIGRWVNKSRSLKRILGGTFIASIIFFVITNFAVWATTPLYAKTIQGLIMCYIMALPFFRNSLIGDIAYAFFFFYGFEYVYSFIKSKVDGLFIFRGFV
jgi:hypothetical protein